MSLYMIRLRTVRAGGRPVPTRGTPKDYEAITGTVGQAWKTVALSALNLQKLEGSRLFDISIASTHEREKRRQVVTLVERFDSKGPDGPKVT